MKTGNRKLHQLPQPIVTSPIPLREWMDFIHPPECYLYGVDFKGNPAVRRILDVIQCWDYFSDEHLDLFVVWYVGGDGETHDITLPGSEWIGWVEK
jgi:hypothetical protein